MATLEARRGGPSGGGLLVGAALGLALLVGGAFYMESTAIDHRLVRDGAERVRVADRYLEEVEAQVRDFQVRREAAFSGVVDASLTARIDAALDAAFAPVHGNIDRYLDFHYSLLGSYTELGAALTGDLSGAMQDHLFDDDFRDGLSSAILTVEDRYRTALSAALDETNAAARAELGFSGEDMRLTAMLTDLSMASVEARFGADLVAGRILGIGAGGLAGRALARQVGRSVSRQLSRNVANQFVGQLARHAGRTAVSRSLGSGGGAATGAQVGLVCGPMAWLCSGVGTVVGAGVGWYMAESTILALDERINRDAYAEELGRTVDAQKVLLRERMLTGSRQLADRVSTCIEDRFATLAEGGSLIAHLETGPARCDTTGR